MAEHVGERIRRHREERRLSQNQLQERAGLGNGYISLVEKGARIPKRPTLEKIAVALGVTVGQLENDTTDEEDQLLIEDRQTQVMLMKLKEVDPEGYRVIRRQVAAMIREVEEADREERNAASRRRARAKQSGSDDQQIQPSPEQPG